VSSGCDESVEWGLWMWANGWGRVAQPIHQQWPWGQTASQPALHSEQSSCCKMHPAGARGTVASTCNSHRSVLNFFCIVGILNTLTVD